MLVSRVEAYARRQYVLVAAVTTRVRGIPTEVRLGAAEGVAQDSVVNCDDLRSVARRALVRRVGVVRDEKLAALDASLKFALGLD